MRGPGAGRVTAQEWSRATRRALLIAACATVAGACTSLNGGDSEQESDAAVGNAMAGRAKDSGAPERDGGGSQRRDGGGSQRRDAGGEDASQPVEAGGASGEDSGRSEPQPDPCVRDGERCTSSGADDGVCAGGKCVECAQDGDCPPTQLTCRRPYCTAEHVCSTRPRPTGSPCGGGFCSADAECVECALDENCGPNAVCNDARCGCEPGHVPNSGGARGCNFDECALDDDHRCGAAQFGGRCTNTDEGYSCSCDPPNKHSLSDRGPQCYRGGAGTIATVTNGATWNLGPGFELVCSNAFAETPPDGCPVDGANKVIHAQVTWLNVCGFGPPPCHTIAADGTGLFGANIQRVSYSAALEDYGESSGIAVHSIDDPKQGDVFVVATLSTLSLMRITAIDGATMSFEWASVWRDHCFRPGGASCSAACGCPGGT